MLKRILALLLAAVLLLGLVACGGGEKGNDEPGAETAGEWEEYNGELPFVTVGEGEERPTITIGLVANANVTDYENNAYTKWLEEKTGLNIDFQLFMDNSQAATQIALMISSGEKLPDIIWRLGSITKQMGEEYGADGYFYPLTDFFEHYAYYTKQSYDICYKGDPRPYEWMLRRCAGTDNLPIYCFPSDICDSLTDPMLQAWINQEWLDKLGLQKPTTPDELYDVLVAFRDKDPNGNGKSDEIPIVGKIYGTYAASDPIGWIMNAYCFYNDQTYFAVENGKITVPYKSEEYREGLKFINKLVKEGLMPEMCWTQDASEMSGITNPAEGQDFKAGVIFGSSVSMFSQGNDSIRVYEPLKPMKDVTGKGGYAPINHTRVLTTYISADCKYPDLAFKLLDFMSSQESYLRQRWGEEGVDWVYSEGGKTGNRGGEAKIKLLNPLVYSEQNAQCWHQVCSVASEEYWQYEVDLTDPDDWNTLYVNKLNEMYKNTMDVPQPDEVFEFAIYSKADYEERADFFGDLRSYMYSRRSEFCTGVLDPNSDSDWQTYLNELDTLHYDRWIELGQIGYDRLFE